MVKQSEKFASDDLKQKELAEAKNQADSLAYSAEKSLKELGDKVEQAKADQVRQAVTDLRTAASEEDLEKIKQASEKLNEFLHELSAKLYEQAQQQQQQQQAQSGGGTAAGEGEPGDGATGGGEDVVDADYNIKDDKNDQGA